LRIFAKNSQGQSIIRLQVHGIPLVKTQADLTEKQRLFLEYGLVKYVNDERKFMISLMGGTPAEEASGETVREKSLERLKNPADLPPPKIKR